MNYKILSIILALVLIVFLALGLDNTFNKPSYYEPSYEEAVMTIEEKERINPAAYLSSDGKYWENLIGQLVIEGRIYNKATVANYKDAVLTVHFYSKTETLIDSKDYLIYEFFKPGQSKVFKIKIEGPSRTAKIGWEVSDATAINL
jgi:hypothetical protein